MQTGKRQIGFQNKCSGICYTFHIVYDIIFDDIENWTIVSKQLRILGYF